ncbi:MAG: heme-binding protein, partial [Bryobacteraceae bacterium]
AIDDPRLVVAVVDRAGRPLGVHARAGASTDDIETALSLARTGAFFSHNEAPLSSRTVRSISTVNFPEGIPNQPAAALYGIENTNRGCDYNTTFLAGKLVPRSTNLSGDGPGKGITTRAGGFPVYRGDDMIGGIGVGGLAPDIAEFAAFSAVAGNGFFKATIPPPRAVFIDGFRLPFAEQTTQPAGTSPAASPGGVDLVPPRTGNAAPDEWIIGPRASADLTEAEVRGIVERAVERAIRTRAVIRLPLGTRARFVYSVTDLQGSILALYRQPDATIFSIDVAITKARNVVYFSGENTAAPDRLPGVPPGTAVTNRTIGFTSQPFFPSGIFNSDPGPFFQLYQFDVLNPCTQGRQPRNPNQSGIVFFPGSAPLYKGGRMVGGFGVSGDGVEQDDYVTAGGAAGFEPPPDRRADAFFVDTRLGHVRLPYWKFPRNPEQ